MNRWSSSNGFVFKMWICFSFSIAVIIWHHNLHVACKLFFFGQWKFLPNIQTLPNEKWRHTLSHSYSLAQSQSLIYHFVLFLMMLQKDARKLLKQNLKDTLYDRMQKYFRIIWIHLVSTLWLDSEKFLTIIIVYSIIILGIVYG